MFITSFQASPALHGELRRFFIAHISLQQEIKHPSFPSAQLHIIMATAAVLPADSSGTGSRVPTGSNPLTAAELPISQVSPDVNAAKVVQDWLCSFQKILDSSNIEGLQQLFLKESYWRDQLCLSWDFHTLRNPDRIVSFLKGQPKGCRLKTLKVDDISDIKKPAVAPIDILGDVKGVNSFLTVETDVGRGRGFARLCRDSKDGVWKAFTLFTVMEELRGHEETVRERRPEGVEHGGKADRKNWKDRRTIDENFDGGAEPTVLIIGKAASLIRSVDSHDSLCSTMQALVREV